MKINWKNKINNQVNTLYFNDLDYGETFRIVGSQAVYIKVGRKPKQYNNYTTTASNPDFDHMHELVTGYLFAPTSSTVEIIDVTVNVDSLKPHIYS